MAGKSYARSVRAHKLTFQALWHFLLPKLYSYLEELDKDYKTDLLESVQEYDTSCSVDTLTNILASDTFKRHMDNFVDHIKNENPNIKFWWNYMEMVNILLYFIRAQRDGLWDLHLFSFRKMLPFFFRYDHTNYARWGTVYLAETNRLPEEIYHEVMNGNFVVKESDKSLNQVDPDHSQEWQNAIGKKMVA